MGILSFPRSPWERLNVLHPTLGVAVSRYAVAGENLTLTGGNCIGRNVQIGAGAVVVTDAPDGAIMLGVPAVNVVRDKAG